MSDHDERRRFQRIDFDAPTELRQGVKRWPAKLLDLSLKGLLIERPANWDADLTQDFDAIIHLAPMHGYRCRLNCAMRNQTAWASSACTSTSSR